MRTGDSLYLLLAAKVVCCGLLVLAAVGLLGGALGWFSGQGFWLVVSLIVAAMALIGWFAMPGRRRGRSG